MSPSNRRGQASAPPRVALSATLPLAKIPALTEVLGLREPRVISVNPLRRNLRFHVVHSTTTSSFALADEVRALLPATGAALVYTTRRALAERLASQLPGARAYPRRHVGRGAPRGSPRIP
ncbi:MAG: hypothetical protein KatS3mg082_1454 [Nitrospiraceae bacterium]|nr:MAG: hypothetical protein KatS3mg082_1454 [Nitrospiraceae bacterium]